MFCRFVRVSVPWRNPEVRVSVSRIKLKVSIEGIVGASNDRFTSGAFGGESAGAKAATVHRRLIYDANCMTAYNAVFVDCDLYGDNSIPALNAPELELRHRSN